MASANRTSEHESSRQPTGGGADAPALEPAGEAPSLEALSPEARGRLVHFIVTSTLERGLAPTAVVALYADLTGDALATRYADQRFMLKQVPSDWHEVEDRVLDLEDAARQRGMDLAAAWRRAAAVAMRGEDPLEQLARLTGTRAGTRRRDRSIFDDPDELTELEDLEDGSARVALEDRLPDLTDLEIEAQQKIRRFAIEERLEHGLPPAELLELYRRFEVGEDDRARQYLDRVFVQREPPSDWIEMQDEAQHVRDLSESRGQDAGRLYADVLRAYAGIDAVDALRVVVERAQRA